MSKENEQNEQQEDNESHNPSNDGVVGTGGRGHWSVLGRTFNLNANLAWDNPTKGKWHQHQEKPVAVCEHKGHAQVSVQVGITMLVASSLLKKISVFSRQ